jgi:hypothetical protein
MGRDLVDRVAEPRLVLTHHMPMQHGEHFRSGPFDDGYTGKQSWPQMLRQDGICWRR